MLLLSFIKTHIHSLTNNMLLTNVLTNALGCCVGSAINYLTYRTSKSYKPTETKYVLQDKICSMALLIPDRMQLSEGFRYMISNTDSSSGVLRQKVKQTFFTCVFALQNQCKDTKRHNVHLFKANCNLQLNEWHKYVKFKGVVTHTQMLWAKWNRIQQSSCW